MLAEVGYADALLARELADGSLMLIDGHLRAETTPDAVVPVLVLDVDEAEADKILLTHDPLAAMATVSRGARSLACSPKCRPKTPPCGAMLEIRWRNARTADARARRPAAERPEVNIPESYQVVVECRDEARSTSRVRTHARGGLSMPSLDVVVSCPVYDSFRVQQVAGMFDVPLAEKATERFQVELPDCDEDVGHRPDRRPVRQRQEHGRPPTQFGRTSFTRGAEWPADRAVIDCFGDVPVRQVVELFTAVGFSSPPSWVKPYQVLSCGERFRCDLARALSSSLAVRSRESRARGFCDSRLLTAELSTPLVVFDEFTSVVDRNVAKVCSAAIAKGIRRGHIPCRFVAVTCHYDVAEWLEADWVLDMATASCTRRRLRRPTIDLEIHRCGLAAWQLFTRHHYLSGSLAVGARCYLDHVGRRARDFLRDAAGDHQARTTAGSRGSSRCPTTRASASACGPWRRWPSCIARKGLRINVTSSHPALIRHCRRSPLWKTVNVKKPGGPPQARRFRDYRSAAGRAVVSFEYVGKVSGVGCPVSVFESDT